MTPAPETEYLCVDTFLTSVIDARAIKSAFELRLIDRLSRPEPASVSQLESELALDAPALRILLGLLAANHVIEHHGAAISLTDTFRAALRYRDLMEAKIDFANMVAGDFVHLFTALLTDPARFMRQARLFELFGYHRCFEESAENIEKTRRWMRFTTALTRYEARACLRHFDFSTARRMLDIGGNSGEFVLQICKRHPAIQATVFDLPVVCRVGQDHVGPEPEANRIAFVAGNAVVDPLPAGFDLVSFKSMLHDWPDEHAAAFLARAREALNPGGRLLIFERAAIDIGPGTPPYSMLPMLLFFRSFRSPAYYETHLQRLGFTQIAVRTIALDLPFVLIEGTRGDVA
jgi:SAM-dependent methyltransferase